MYNSSYAPTNAGSYRVTADVVETNFDGTVSADLNVSPAAQDPITFISTSNMAFGSVHQLVAIGGSGSGSLSYVRMSGSCAVNSSTGSVSASTVGTCVVRANREASANYLSATSGTQSIQINKGSQSVAFTSNIPSSTVIGTQYVPTASSTSGLPTNVTISNGANTVCSLSANTLTILASGLCEISASQTGDSNWQSATTATQIIEVGKLSQAITFSQPVSFELGGPGFVPDVSSSSGLNVEIVVISGGSVCSLAVTGLVTFQSVGTCTLEATQPGDTSFSPASAITRIVTVLPAVPNAPHISSVSAGDGTVTVGYAAPSSNGGSPILSYSLTASSSTAPTIVQSNCSTSTMYCTLVGLVNTASYSVSVTAINIRGAGPASESAEVMIPSPNATAVQSVNGVRDTTNLDVLWEDPNTYGDGAFVQYEVSVRERGGLFGSPVTVQSLMSRTPDSQSELTPAVFFAQVDGVVRVLTTRTHSARFTNLDPSRMYETKIVTVTSTARAETSSNTASALVMPLALPSAPRSLQVDAVNSSTALVSWSAPATDGGSPLLSFSINSSVGSCVPATLLARTCTIIGLQSGVSVVITARANNTVGASIASVSIYTMPSAPAAPALGIIATTTKSATVTWTAPQTNGGRPVTSYSVIASDAKAPTIQFRCTTSSLTCVIHGLTSGTSYSFVATATNSIGTSVQSTAVKASTNEMVVVPAPSLATVNKTDWNSFRNSTTSTNAIALRLPPAPARVTVQSLSGGKRTRVTALRNVQANEIPITYAIISVSNRTNKLLARIKVQVDPNNPTTSVSVPYASKQVKVSVQFANQIGISSGGPAGVNIAEGNTFEWTTASGRSSIAGDVVPGNLTFARGKSVVSADMKKTLAKMAVEAKNRGGLVYVSGFAARGEIASSWLLEPLARARAEAVSKYLAKIGVRQWITFHGSDSPIATSWGATSGRQVIITTVSQVAA